MSYETEQEQFAKELESVKTDSKFWIIILSRILARKRINVDII